MVWIVLCKKGRKGYEKTNRSPACQLTFGIDTANESSWVTSPLNPTNVIPPHGQGETETQGTQAWKMHRARLLFSNFNLGHMDLDFSRIPWEMRFSNCQTLQVVWCKAGAQHALHFSTRRNTMHSSYKLPGLYPHSESQNSAHSFHAHLVTKHEVSLTRGYWFLDFSHSVWPFRLCSWEVYSP